MIIIIFVFLFVHSVIMVVLDWDTQWVVSERLFCIIIIIFLYKKHCNWNRWKNTWTRCRALSHKEAKIWNNNQKSRFYSLIFILLVVYSQLSSKTLVLSPVQSTSQKAGIHRQQVTIDRAHTLFTHIVRASIFQSTRCLCVLFVERKWRRWRKPMQAQREFPNSSQTVNFSLWDIHCLCDV